MRLIYTQTGKEVKVGDKVDLYNGIPHFVTSFRKPHKPASNGFVSVISKEPNTCEQEFYPQVIGAKWIEREDRGEGPTEDFTPTRHDETIDLITSQPKVTEWQIANGILYVWLQDGTCIDMTVPHTSQGPNL